MAIAPEALAALRAHLKRKAISLKCPVCGESKWIAHGPMAAVYYADIDPAVSQHGKETLPTIVIVCTNCALVRHFAWLVMEQDVELIGGANV